MHTDLRRVVLDSGLWDQGRELTHGFLLSPEAYRVSRERQTELEKLAEALHDCLAGLGRIAAIAANPKLIRGSGWGMLVKIFNTGIPACYQDLVGLHPGSVPAICKVDFMEAQDGALRIAEVDGHNKHGLGYSTLAARIRRVASPGAQAFPGVAQAVANEIRRRGEESALLLYADQERFYLPEFRIFKAELARLGIRLEVANELEAPEIPRLLIDLPFLFKNHKLDERLRASYQAGGVGFLIPPKPFLGSKGALAVLRNDTEDRHLEAILHSQIRSASLELLRRYIPKTFLVHKRERKEAWLGRLNGDAFVLKEVISSGMKGTVFMGEPHWENLLDRACGSYYRFILQEEVRNRSHRFRYFEPDGTPKEADWFLRVTVHFSMRRVADVVVTARQDKKVHGALDCLQLGAVLTA